MRSGPAGTPVDDSDPCVVVPSWVSRLAGARQLRHLPGAMRSTCSALLVVTLVVGCEHKSKKDDNPPPPDKPGAASGAPKSAPTPPPADDLKPEPVGKAPAVAPPAAPPSGDELRAPVAEDLAEYTKDVAGNGALAAAIETSMGTFHCQLFADKAPATVANF